MPKSLKTLFSINPATITFAVIGIICALFVTGSPIFELIELKTYDLRFRSRGYLKPTPAVVLALIDEKSLGKDVGPGPVPRSPA